MASNARSGVKSPVLKPSEPGGRGDKSEKNKARSAISQAWAGFPRKNQGHGKSVVMMPESTTQKPQGYPEGP